jgi:hypothetical protein
MYSIIIDFHHGSRMVLIEGCDCVPSAMKKYA